MNLQSENLIDVSSPHTADRGPSRTEGKTEIVATNQSHVNKPADQWEPGGKDTILERGWIVKCLNLKERQTIRGWTLKWSISEEKKGGRKKMVNLQL